MKLNFMLIDDSKIDLFINQKIIEKVASKSHIRNFTSPISAINYLKVLEGNTRCQAKFAPDIIFLDINMPQLNGFQFINEFNKLKFKNKENIKLYILSSSTNAEDVQRAKKQRSCIGFLNKPLTMKVIEEILVQSKPFLTMHDCQECDYSVENNN